VRCGEGVTFDPTPTRTDAAHLLQRVTGRRRRRVLHDRYILSFGQATGRAIRVVREPRARSRIRPPRGGGPRRVYGFAGGRVPKAATLPFISSRRGRLLNWRQRGSRGGRGHPASAAYRRLQRARARRAPDAGTAPAGLSSLRFAAGRPARRRSWRRTEESWASRLTRAAGSPSASSVT
jgi:hypothetical protein